MRQRGNVYIFVILISRPLAKKATISTFPLKSTHFRQPVGCLLVQMIQYLAFLASVIFEVGAKVLGEGRKTHEMVWVDWMGSCDPQTVSNETSNNLLYLNTSHLTRELKLSILLAMLQTFWRDNVINKDAGAVVDFI